MSSFRVLAASEQLAIHLKGRIATGALSGQMPGVHRIAAEFGVHRRTADEALRQLEREKLVVSQGSGRRRRIVGPGRDPEATSMRVAILLGFPEDARAHYIVDFHHRLLEAGHTAGFAGRTLSGLGMEARRVARLVAKTDADAWVVVGGSREVLEWFSAQPLPAFAFFGRRRGLPIAGIGPDKVMATRAATRRLLELGHRRIVLLARAARRLPHPGANEREFLAELASAGLATGSYNLPDWGEHIDGLHRCLDSMFRLTPPTALIVDEPPLFAAVQQHLARAGILAPEHVSLVCTDGDPHFVWQRPSVAHIAWDSRPWVRRVVQWANNVSHGGEDRRQSLTKAAFVEGGTVGPVPAGR